MAFLFFPSLGNVKFRKAMEIDHSFFFIFKEEGKLSQINANSYRRPIQKNARNILAISTGHEFRETQQ
jgi:hypothetical protein